MILFEIYFLNRRYLWEIFLLYRKMENKVDKLKGCRNQEWDKYLGDLMEVANIVDFRVDGESYRCKKAVVGIVKVQIMVRSG